MPKAAEAMQLLRTMLDNGVAAVIKSSAKLRSCALKTWPSDPRKRFGGDVARAVRQISMTRSQQRGDPLSPWPSPMCDEMRLAAGLEEAYAVSGRILSLESRE
jgi:hypothetical protein